MKRILFVDDELRILEGLRRMLHPLRKQWEMHFANSGQEALAILGTAPFDAVVTDMRMPVMDGAALLEAVQERFPGVIRIVLSGYSEMEASLRAAPVAHQCLSKPCDPQKLREAIERCCSSTALIADDAARRVVGAVGKLPSLPSTCASLQAALRDPDASLVRIGEIIERDVGMTAKVLQLVNSAFFGLGHEITSVSMAVSHLGLDILSHLVLNAEIFRTFQPARPVRGFSMSRLQGHSQLAGQIAARLPAARLVSATAVVATLLHDSGKLVLASRLPAPFEEAVRISQQDQRPMHMVEKEVVGASHAEIGAYLLALWGLPKPIVDAVCRHHDPPVPPPGQGLDVLAITHVANALAFELSCGPGLPAFDHPLNTDYLDALGLTPEYPAWRAIASAVAAAIPGEPVAR